MVWWKIALAAIAAVIVWQLGVSPVWFIIAGAATGILHALHDKRGTAGNGKGGNAMIYLQLLLSYLKIGFFGFGGGYAMLSLIQNEIVVQRGWLTSEQLTDIIAISQVTPGPIAINSATYVGYAVTGTVWVRPSLRWLPASRRLP